MSVAADGRLAGQQLVQRRPEAVDVDPVVDQAVLGQRLLRGHVPQRAEQVAAHRQAGVGAEPGQAEVADVHLAGGVQQQVARLDVAVDDAERVGVLQGVGGVGDQFGGAAEELAARRAGPLRREGGDRGGVAAFGEPGASATGGSAGRRPPVADAPGSPAARPTVITSASVCPSMNSIA